MTASHRSIHPNIPGVPWWAAIVIAVTATAVGFAFDAGSANKELTDVFAMLYAVGCVAAVLAVRQSGIFTAVIQPPLILFCAVPGAYWVFHGTKITGLKDLLIDCGYPLIERFPLMLFTSAGVLLIGMIRWYWGMAARSAGAATAESDTATGGRIRGIAAKLASIIGRDPTEPARRAKAGRTAAARREKSNEAASGRPARRPAATRSRRGRASRADTPEPTPQRTRRRRPTQARDVDATDPPRRSRVPRDPDLRGRVPREVRRDEHVRRSRGTTRSNRFDPYEPTESYGSAEPRRHSAPSGATATHHPISRVRYRSASGDDARPREPRKPWE